MADSNLTPEIPYGYCHCGCGQLTPLAVQTNNAIGNKKGQPQRYVFGHTKRSIRPKSYRGIKHGDGVELLHRVRAEKALGHPLPPGAEVHHPDEDPWNRDARLVICQDHGYHKLLHVRMRIKAAGGNPNTDKMCGFCHRPKPLTEFYKGKYNNYCKPCHLLYIQTRRAIKSAELATVIDKPAEPLDT